MNNEKSIWILEDDKDCRFVYEQMLDFRYKTEYFENIAMFKEALLNDERVKPALVLADLMLPDGNFLNFLTETKESQFLKTPFVIVSSIDDIDALRFCFNEGALDYLTKPFKKNELLVKIENILSGRNSQAVIGNDRKDLTLDGTKIANLTSKQLQVLSLFLNSPNRIINRSDILDKVWGNTTVHPKTVDVHLYNLRRKLHPYGYFIRSEGGGRWCLMSDKIDHGPVNL